MKNNTNPLANIIEFKIEKKNMNFNLNDIVFLTFLQIIYFIFKFLFYYKK